MSASSLAAMTIACSLRYDFAGQTNPCRIEIGLDSDFVRSCPETNCFLLLIMARESTPTTMFVNTELNKCTMCAFAFSPVGHTQHRSLKNVSIAALRRSRSVLSSAIKG